MRRLLDLGEISAAILLAGVVVERELRELVASHAHSDAALIGCMQLDRLGQRLPAGCRLP